MTQEPETTSGKVAKLNRVERNAWTKRKIFDAATRIVGKYGYAEASVARITEEAGVAQGTFYNHFENRQELLDQLLPKIGLDMLFLITSINTILIYKKIHIHKDYTSLITYTNILTLIFHKIFIIHTI